MPSITVQTVKNRFFLEEFLEFIKKEYADENFRFLFDKASNEALYNKYVKVGTPDQVNIPDSIRKPLDTLAAGKKWSSMSSGIKDARVEIANVVNKGPIPRFIATKEGKWALFMLSTGIDKPKVETMEALVKVFQTGRTAQDKLEAYEAMLKLTNKALLNPAMRTYGLTPPVPVVKAKGDPSKALRLLGVPEPLKKEMTKLIAEYTKATSKTHRATLIDKMERVSKGIVKDDAIIAALKGAGLYDPN